LQDKIDHNTVVIRDHTIRRFVERSVEAGFGAAPKNPERSIRRLIETAMPDFTMTPEVARLRQNANEGEPAVYLFNSGWRMVFVRDREDPSLVVLITIERDKFKKQRYAAMAERAKHYFQPAPNFRRRER